MSRPNVLVILTDQLRYPPPYESEDLAAWRREVTPGQERLGAEEPGAPKRLTAAAGGRPGYLAPAPV